MAFEKLHPERYMSLTTYRKSGKAVPTPVWFAPLEDQLVVMTIADSGKVKRLRHTARVEIAPCTARGEITGDSMSAQGRIIHDEQEARSAHQVLMRKYNWQLMIFLLLYTVTRKKRAYLAIEPPE